MSLQTKSAMDSINKESHRNVNALDQICDSTIPSEIDLITEQGLEEISTQVSASVQNIRRGCTRFQTLCLLCLKEN